MEKIIESLEIEPKIELNRQLHWEQLPNLVVDVDSCATNIEGIDLLAEMKGKQTEVVKMTTAAMNDEVPFEAVFGLRLEMIQPKETDLINLGRLYLETITPQVPEVIKIAQLLGINIHLMSGGYDQAIWPLAGYLGIPKNKVFANHLFFDEHGSYAGFDKTNPLCRKGGKLTLIQQLKTQAQLLGPIGIIGDGASEVETKPAVDLCIGFGGHVAREKVKKDADVFLTQPTFMPVLPLILGKEGVKQCLQDNAYFDYFIRQGLDCLERAKFQNRAVGVGEEIKLMRETNRLMILYKGGIL